MCVFLLSVDFHQNCDKFYPCNNSAWSAVSETHRWVSLVLLEPNFDEKQSVMGQSQAREGGQSFKMIAGAFSFSANYFFSYVLSPLKLDPRLSVKASGEGLEHRAQRCQILGS